MHNADSWSHPRSLEYVSHRTAASHPTHVREHVCYPKRNGSHESKVSYLLGAAEMPVERRDTRTLLAAASIRPKSSLGSGAQHAHRTDELVGNWPQLTHPLLNES